MAHNEARVSYRCHSPKPYSVLMIGLGGLFVEPTIFKNVGKNSRIQQEEVFGPVVTVKSSNNQAFAGKC